ncbi:MAG: PTS sugar transporter subunit IIB [Brevinema sp.]
MVKICTVCHMGIGTSLLLKMSVDKALSELNIEGSVMCSEYTTAPSTNSDLYITSPGIAEKLEHSTTAPIISVNEFMNINEISTKLKNFFRN